MKFKKAKFEGIYYFFRYGIGLLWKEKSFKSWKAAWIAGVLTAISAQTRRKNKINEQKKDKDV